MSNTLSLENNPHLPEIRAIVSVKSSFPTTESSASNIVHSSAKCSSTSNAKTVLLEPASGLVTILQEPAAKHPRGLTTESNGEDYYLHARVNMFVCLFEHELSVKSLNAVPLAQL